MKADSRVVSGLIASAGVLATLVEQFRCDRLALKATDCKWLAGCYGEWYECAEHQLGKFIKRIFKFNGQPTYAVGKMQASADVKGLLTRNLAALQSAFDSFCQLRAQAYEIRADYTPDDYEHAIEFLEDAITKHEIQLALIADLGQGAYIGSRLEDE